MFAQYTLEKLKLIANSRSQNKVYKNGLHENPGIYDYTIYQISSVYRQERNCKLYTKRMNQIRSGV